MIKVGMVIVAVLSTIAGTVWGASEYVQTLAKRVEVEAVAKAAKEDVAKFVKALNDEVQVAGTKADFVLDQQMAALIAQISYLEQKRNKTQEEIAQLNYLRQQLDHMRKVRSGR